VKITINICCNLNLELATKVVKDKKKRNESKKQAKANKGPKHNLLVKWNCTKMQGGAPKPLKFIPTFGSLES
jgi:hypothetical protein